MKLSIVTICYNDLDGLKATVESLRKQTTFEFEQWVIDGASKDGTPEYLKDLQVPWDLHFISEKDRGIYNAMNKGKVRATGDFVWFLNSGDICADTTSIARWIDAIRLNPDADVLYGQVWFQGSQGHKKVGRPVTAFNFRSEMPLCHQGIIYRRAMLEKTSYREDLRIVSDWVLTEWFFENGKAVYIDGLFAIYNLTGVSTQQLTRMFREKLRAEKRWLRKIHLSLTLGVRFYLITFLRKLGVYALVQRLKYTPGEVTSPTEKNT